MRTLRSPCFRPDMRAAIRDGRKMQTRRVIEPQPVIDGSCAIWQDKPYTLAELAGQCPYGQPGDRWLLREPLRRKDRCAVYADDGERVVSRHSGRTLLWRWKGDALPQVFMPTEAARDTCEVVETRTEWLQKITRDDAIAEGIEARSRTHTVIYRNYRFGDYGEFMAFFLSPIPSFRSLWITIHSVDSWCANRRVWVIAFKFMGEIEGE